MAGGSLSSGRSAVAVSSDENLLDRVVHEELAHPVHEGGRVRKSGLGTCLLPQVETHKQLPSQGRRPATPNTSTSQRPAEMQPSPQAKTAPQKTVETTRVVELPTVEQLPQTSQAPQNQTPNPAQQTPQKETPPRTKATQSSPSVGKGNFVVRDPVTGQFRSQNKGQAKAHSSQPSMRDLPPQPHMPQLHPPTFTLHPQQPPRRPPPRHPPASRDYEPLSPDPNGDIARPQRPPTAVSAGPSRERFSVLDFDDDNALGILPGCDQNVPPGPPPPPPPFIIPISRPGRSYEITYEALSDED